MHAAKGILTTRGGMTSHAAVVARGMGRPCVAGAGSITVDYATQTPNLSFAYGNGFTVGNPSTGLSNSRTIAIRRRSPTLYRH